MKDCRRIRRAVSQTASLPAELEQHLFSCSACRRFVRAEQILGRVHEFRQPSALVSPQFVERVMSGLAGREKKVQKRRSNPQLMRWAAVLMFSIAAGYGFSVSQAAVKSIEWAASLTVVTSPINSIEIL